MYVLLPSIFRYNLILVCHISQACDDESRSHFSYHIKDVFEYSINGSNVVLPSRKYVRKFKKHRWLPRYTIYLNLCIHTDKEKGRKNTENILCIRNKIMRPCKSTLWSKNYVQRIFHVQKRS